MGIRNYMPLRPTETITEQQTSTIHRVSVGLIAVSLSLMSLALGTALYVSPGAAFLFLPGTVEQQSVPSTATAVTLTWTAPGDDGNTGQAVSYDIRYSASPITDLNFSQAAVMTAPPTPSVAGTTETVTITGLQPATTYYFALRATDDAGNVSAMSNVPTKTTSALPQACVPTYTCSEWSACVNGIQTKTCSSNNGCPAGLDEPITQQSCTAPPVGGEPVHVVKSIIVAGLAPGRTSAVRVIDPSTKKVTKEIFPFGKTYRNGVSTAAGDVNGDQLADVVVGTGIGSDPLVKVFGTDGKLQTSFNPYATEHRTGVEVATGDVDGDGSDEIITVPGKSAAQVRIWHYDAKSKKFYSKTQLFAYDRTQRQGFSLAAGDLDGDNRAEIVVAPRANGQSVVVLRLDASNTLQLVKRFSAFPLQFKTGLTLAAGDVYGNGRMNIIVTSGPGYYSEVRIFDVNGVLKSTFLPMAKTVRTGISLTTLDVNRDGREEIVAGSYQNGVPELLVFRYDGIKKKFSRIQNYLVFPRITQNGLRLGGI